MTAKHYVGNEADDGAALKRGRSQHRPYKPGIGMRLLLNISENIKRGTLEVVFPDGQVHRFVGAADPDLYHAVCVIKNDRFAWKFLVRGILGFCEAYIDGDWETPDMTTLFLLALANEQDWLTMLGGRHWWRIVEGGLSLLRRNTRSGSRRNIAQHYDLGNEFYAQWLDRSMTYSSGLFTQTKPGDNDALYQAQQAKYRNLAAMLDLQPHHRLLEIGCGWGGFAEYAAREIGCHVTGLTISQEQFDYATNRIAASGLTDKVDIQLRDYRDCQGQYDRAVAIEMFEAVGEEYWPKFFDTVRDRLLPGGIAAMQVITIDAQFFDLYRRGADYIQKYIFPGGLLPTFAHLREQVAKAKLQWRDDMFFGEDYARTLAEWGQRFAAAWPSIKPLGFDEPFYRMWAQYFCYCEAGFKAKTINVCQFSFIKPA